MSNKRAPNWSREEIMVLLENHSLSDEVLAEKLSRRSMDAINIVRRGIHDLHNGKKNDLLSKLMIELIHSYEEALSCAICGERIQLIIRSQGAGFVSSQQHDKHGCTPTCFLYFQRP